MYVYTFSLQNDTIYTYNPSPVVRPRITGTDGPDALNGFASDDIITGLAGDDTLTGGPGHDEFHFTRGFGHDTITDYQPGDSIWLDGFNINGNELAGFEALRLFFDPTSDTLRIRLTWNGVTDQLDVLNVARTAATNDMFRMDGYPISLPPSTEGADTLFAANIPNAELTALGGDDTLVGTIGSQRLDGGEGNDLFYEWDGADTLIGGTGFDTAVYAGTRDSYRVGIAGDTVLVQARYGTATLTEIEAIRFADTGTISLEDLRAAPGTEEVVTLLAGGTPTFLMPQAYAGPLALAYQFAGTAIDDVMRGTSRNDFAILGAGSDAADMGAGDDIVDGGAGSNFLTGGEGRDVFFVDARIHLPVWSCITDFEAGEELAIWGWNPNYSIGAWGEDGGLPGWTGATFYADIDGNGLVETVVTLSGVTMADAPTTTAQPGLLWFR